MLKQTIEFEDYNGDQTSETLYFNLNKTELIEMEALRPRLDAWLKSIGGTPRDLTPAESLEMLHIIKIIIERSYGVRSADGKRFEKTPEIFREFTQTAAYDAFIFWLIEDPDRANTFMEGVLPKDIAANSRASTAATVVSLPSADQNKNEKTFADYTPKELEELPQEEFERIVGRDPSKMSREQLQAAFRRKNSSPSQ